MSDIPKIVRFIQELGIPVKKSRARPKTFVPGVWADHGTLMFDAARLQAPSDLFHEAGHIAVTPSLFRPLISKAMNFDPPPPLFRAHVVKYLDEHPDGMTSYPEDPVVRGILQSGEAETIAWSYAAMVACGVDLDIYWAKDMANFGGKAPEVRQGLDMRSHLGINGLQAAGMTTVRTFPKMTRWLQL